MHELLGPHQLPKRAVGRRAETLLPGSHELRGNIVESDRTKAVSVEQIHESELRTANACRILQHALEHRLQIAR